MMMEENSVAMAMASQQTQRTIVWCATSGRAFHGQLTWLAVPLAPVRKGGGGGVCGHVRCGPRGQDQEVGDLAAFL